MTGCELLPKCLYFNDKLKNMPIASGLAKTMYCLWHYEECARFMVARVMSIKNTRPIWPNVKKVKHFQKLFTPSCLYKL